jgi:hypothetical protein
VPAWLIPASHCNHYVKLIFPSHLALGKHRHQGKNDPAKNAVLNEALTVIDQGVAEGLRMHAARPGPRRAGDVEEGLED